MKKTKEIEKDENIIEQILKFDSLDDAEKFAEVARGRKFCKKGERVQDICNEELENYICKKSSSLILKIYLHYKKKKNKERLLLESRVTSVIRAVAIDFINNEEELIEEDLVKKVKNTILEQVKKYKEKVKLKEKTENNAVN